MRASMRTILSWLGRPLPILLAALRFVPQLLSPLAFWLLLAALVAALVAVAWVAIDIPEENEVAAAQTSIIYWNDGEKEMARLGDTNRISVPIEEIPDHAAAPISVAKASSTRFSTNGLCSVLPLSLRR